MLVGEDSTGFAMKPLKLIMAGKTGLEGEEVAVSDTVGVVDS